MKVEIIVEQFDNGISLKWKDAEREEDTKAIVAIEGIGEKSEIGKMIWNDVLCVMNNKMTNKVRMRIEYEKVTEIEIHPIKADEVDYPGTR